MARLEYHADEALRLAGTTVTPETRPVLMGAMYDPVRAAYERHWREQNRDRLLELVNSSPLDGAPPIAVSAVSLAELFDAWRAVATVKPRTVAETEYAIKLLGAFAGHDDAARITRADMLRWRGTMKADGGSNNTWNNRLSMVRQVFLRAVDDDALTTDPTVDLRLDKSKPASPLPYSDDDAARILLAARRESTPALRWAHWIMAFTGMRAGEVLQLLGRDVRQDGGVWLIDVNEDHPTKSVKTSERRHVPVHPALIREGFVTYAQTIAADAPLFPDKGLTKQIPVG
jgi:integrase